MSKITDNIISWNGKLIEKSEMEKFCKQRKMITWYISEKCNFKCHYCGVWRTKQNHLLPIDIEKLTDGLNALEGEWIIYISGGEPFLEKNFVDICKVITQKHFLAFSSNFSTPNVYDFADQIDPKRCLFINASVHIVEREKTENGLNSYIEKLLYLQNKGFNVIAAYVAYPELFDRINNDFELLKSKGILKVKAKIFMGDYNFQSYPLSLNQEQKNILKTLDADYPEFDIMNNQYNFHGLSCNAGLSSFAMDRDGNLNRCSSVSKEHGNLFYKKILVDKKPLPCPKTKYLCIHECIENNNLKKANKSSIFKEDLPEKKQELKKWTKKKIMLSKRVIKHPFLVKQFIVDRFVNKSINKEKK